MPPAPAAVESAVPLAVVERLAGPTAFSRTRTAEDSLRDRGFVVRPRQSRRMEAPAGLGEARGVWARAAAAAVRPVPVETAAPLHSQPAGRGQILESPGSGEPLPEGGEEHPRDMMGDVEADPVEELEGPHGHAEGA